MITTTKREINLISRLKTPGKEIRREINSLKVLRKEIKERKAAPLGMELKR